MVDHWNEMDYWIDSLIIGDGEDNISFKEKVEDD